MSTPETTSPGVSNSFTSPETSIIAETFPHGARVRNPRLLVPWVRRGFDPDAWMTGEETRFRCLPRLLYHAAPESGEWRRAADRLIGEWHD